MLRTRVLAIWSVTAVLVWPALPAEAASCGNGTIGGTEQCDDGNAVSGDGCQSDCTVQEGWYCYGSHPSHCVPLPVVDCGNGIVDTGETCDDGNTDPGDGCQSNCIVQPGYSCSGEPSACTASESNLDCGDGNLDYGEECDDGDNDTGDGCGENCQLEDDYVCTGEPSVCTPTGTNDQCGDAQLDAGEECDDGDNASGDGCRADCTIEDGYACTGEPSDCTPTGAIGECGNGLLEQGEDCDSGPCCDDVTCRYLSSVTVCRAAAGSCDLAERCTGSSSICPSDAKRISTAVCRASAGGCDVVERCDGSSDDCPADLVTAGGTVCRPAVSDACDVAESCTGTSGECPADVLLGCPDTDGIDCVHPACDVSGECTVSDECLEICRDPGFWATRGGDDSPIDDVLGEAGPLEVCGQLIDDAGDLGDLDSALEALCVRSEGGDQRQLFRQLVATSLNCAISEGGTCDEILGRFIDVSFSDCDALCRGEEVVDGPTLEECVGQLECFNEGGQVIDGLCAQGTCLEDSTRLCGGDYGACDVVGALPDGPPDNSGNGSHGLGHDRGNRGNAFGRGLGLGHGNDDVEDDELTAGCVPFDDNCEEARLCSDGSDAEATVCPDDSRPTSQRECRQARRNGCTIDACP